MGAAVANTRHAHVQLPGGALNFLFLNKASFMKWRIRSFFKTHLALNIFGLAVLFVLIDGIYSFCSKPKAINCPAFSDATFDAWFPYQPNQVLHFTSSLQTGDSLSIESNRKNEAYSGTGDCEMSAQIVSKERWNSSNRLFIDYHDMGSTTGLLFLSLSNFQVNGNLLERSFVPEGSNVKSHFAASATLAGHTFANVIDIELDTAIYKAAGVYKVWLSKGTGLVAYERYPSLEQFIKQ